MNCKHQYKEEDRHEVWNGKEWNAFFTCTLCKREVFCEFTGCPQNHDKKHTWDESIYMVRDVEFFKAECTTCKCSYSGPTWDLKPDVLLEFKQRVSKQNQCSK